MILLFIVSCFYLFSQENVNDNGFQIGDTSWKFNGEIRFIYTDQANLKSRDLNGELNSFNQMYQRYRFGVIGSFGDRLSAVFTMQVGEEQWGNKNYNEREINVRTLYAYLQFRPEFLGDNTSLRVGLQGYDDIFENSVFTGEAVGIIVKHSTETVTSNIGYLKLFTKDTFDSLGSKNDRFYYPCNEGLILFDTKISINNSLTLNGAFYYDYFNNLAIDYFNESSQYNMSFYGIGGHYKLSDKLDVGGHFVYRNGEYLNRINSISDYSLDIEGWFAYVYSQYKINDFCAKFNFGYTPYKGYSPIGEDNYSITYWGGAFALIDGSFFGHMQFTENARGAQKQTAYGLELYGNGEICDLTAENNGYGGLNQSGGLMVISANLNYDFMFLNIGLLTDTSDHNGFQIDNQIGTEIDIGVKTELISKLEFSAVYAHLFTGDYYKFGNDSVKLNDPYELSMQLRYKF